VATFDSGNPSPPELPQGRSSTPKLEKLRRPAFNLDRQGWTQAIGGLVIALIALYSSYDHISLPAFQIRINQQWGVWFIAASLAFVFIDAQLATGSRSRAAHDAAEERDRANQERYRTDLERNRANQERNRANQERYQAAEARERQAEGTERQGQGIALLRGAALLSARYQLDPTELNRSRLSAYLALLSNI
jgi:hypothetical protein